MSIFERECATRTSGVICKHIDKFYKNIGGDPAVFYLLDRAELPGNPDIIATKSDTGDDCHREVVGVGNGALKKKFKGKPFDQFFICDGKSYRPLNEHDIAEFKRKYG